MTPDLPASSDGGRDAMGGSPPWEGTSRTSEDPAGYRLLAHTADTAFEAWGPSRAGCYAEAVRALVASFADVSSAPLVDRLHVGFGPAAHEEVLVDLLAEVIYLLDTRGLVVAEADLRDEADGALRGQLELSDVEAVQASGAVPKAVTYHGLRVDPGDGGWRCHVTVDV